MAEPVPAGGDPARSGAESLADLSTPSALLIDLDGTLVDTVGRRIDAWLAAFAAIDIEADRERVGGLIGADGKRLARDVAAAAGVHLSDEAVAAVDRDAGQRFSAMNTRPTPLPGARDLFLALQGSAVSIVIATSSLAAQVRSSVAALELPEPPIVVDGERVEHAKPAPDLLLLAADRVDVRPGECWVIGDATWDVLAGTAAGMTVIGVPSGAVDAATLVDAGAAVAIGTLDELTAELRRRGLAT